MSFFDVNKIYEFALINVNGTKRAILGSGSVGITSLRFFTSDPNREYQRWTVTYVNSTPDYPYRLRVRQTGFYMSTHCDYKYGKDCSQGTVNRATLISAADVDSLPASAWWSAVPFGGNDGAYRFHSKGTGRGSKLEGNNISIFMTTNLTAGHGGKWTLTPIANLDPSEPSSLPSSSPSPPPTSATFPRISGGAIAGIVLGIVIVIGILIGAFIFWCRRRRVRPMHPKPAPTIQQRKHLTLEIDGHPSSELDGLSVSYSQDPSSTTEVNRSPAEDRHLSVLNTPKSKYSNGLLPGRPMELP